MKDFINKLYKNHSLIYKVLLFMATTFLLVYLFPKSGKFKYSFENGKPWQSENLYAPFDFALKKTNVDLDLEKKTITDNAALYFDVDVQIILEINSNYDSQFNLVFSDSLIIDNQKDLFKQGKEILIKMYSYGVLDKEYDYPGDKQIVVLEDRKQTKITNYSNFITQNGIRLFLEKEIESQDLSKYKPQYLSLFFDIIKSNVSLNESITNNSLQEELDKISSVRGSIERGTLIVSKGEVVEGDKLKILKSLQSEYESQVWSESSFNWIIAAYTLLVALALLMLLLFLRKYRLEVFNDNTKVTFIFFNILLMVFLTTLVANYNSSYIYIVPICILPLVLKAFFDARLGLFTHVITVLLLGFVVSNNYEYMFLQIIAGIVTILTVSELYKRANLFISVAQITLIYIVAYFAFFVIHEGSVDNLKWETFVLFIFMWFGYFICTAINLCL